MSYSKSEQKYHPLYCQVGTGIRNFAKAYIDWQQGKYVNMAINPFSLLPVKLLVGDNFKYIQPPNTQYPIIRFDKPQLPHFPKSDTDIKVFSDWFYDCLEAGEHLSTYQTHSIDEFESEVSESEEEYDYEYEMSELDVCEDINAFVVPDDYVEYESD